MLVLEIGGQSDRDLAAAFIDGGLIETLATEYRFSLPRSSYLVDRDRDVRLLYVFMKRMPPLEGDSSCLFFAFPDLPENAAWPNVTGVSTASDGFRPSRNVIGFEIRYDGMNRKLRPMPIEPDDVHRSKGEPQDVLRGLYGVMARTQEPSRPMCIGPAHDHWAQDPPRSRSRSHKSRRSRPFK
jgi:hypothetical protein